MKTIEEKPAARSKDRDHLRWLGRAAEVAERHVDKGGSPHPRVRVGAVLVDEKGREIAVGANRFAKGVDYTVAERYADGARSLWINCAEQMAIAQAVRHQENLKGATLYVTLSPCAVCAGLIAECGIARVVVPKDSCRAYGRLKLKWKKSIAIGAAKLQEAGVKVLEIEES